jgi:hypothetical protein
MHGGARRSVPGPRAQARLLSPQPHCSPATSSALLPLFLAPPLSIAALPNFQTLGSWDPESSPPPPPPAGPGADPCTVLALGCPRPLGAPCRGLPRTHGNALNQPPSPSPWRRRLPQAIAAGEPRAHDPPGLLAFWQARARAPVPPRVGPPAALLVCRYALQYCALRCPCPTRPFSNPAACHPALGRTARRWAPLPPAGRAAPLLRPLPICNRPLQRAERRGTAAPHAANTWRGANCLRDGGARGPCAQAS